MLLYPTILDYTLSPLLFVGIIILNILIYLLGEYYLILKLYVLYTFSFFFEFLNF